MTAIIGRMVASNPILFTIMILQCGSLFYDLAHGNWKRGVMLALVGLANAILLTIEE